ncbi:Rab family GTPase, partial [Muriicola sp.]
IVKSKVHDRPTVVIGNKKDLVPEEEVSSLLEEHDIPYDYLTSAKTGETVEEAFLHLASILHHDP